MTSGHSFPKTVTMAKRKLKLEELFGEMSDLSDEETLPPRDRPPTPGRRLTIVPRVGKRKHSAVIERRRGEMPRLRRLRRPHRLNAEPMNRRHRQKGASLSSPILRGQEHHHHLKASRTSGMPQHDPWRSKTLLLGPEPDHRRSPPPGNGGCLALRRASLRPDHHPSGLFYLREGRSTSRTSQFIEAGSINSGSPATDGLCGLTAGAG